MNETKMKKPQNILWIIMHIICIFVVGVTVVCVVLRKSDPPIISQETGIDCQEPMAQAFSIDIYRFLQDDQYTNLKLILLREAALKEVKVEYQDKKLSILGDSISTYEGWIPDGYAQFFPMEGDVGNVNDTWWKMLMDDTGLQFCANSSSAGSTCVGDSLSVDNPKYACSNYRIDALIGKGGIYPDIIIVYMGTNDLLIGVPLGENDGTQPVDEGTVDTFSDAYSLILDKLESQYPGAQIFCCTLVQIGDWGVKHPFETFVNSLNLTAQDYSRQITIIAENKGFNVVDLINCGITEDNMHKYVTDGVHLNTKGMKLVRDVIEDVVISSLSE